LSGASVTALRTRVSPLVPLLLFATSAGFILWRNTQVGVLVDIAYVLNTATRIAAGDVPYAHFPLVLAPGEFLIQALLIKAFGPHFFLQIAYATILGGLATVFTYAIARRLLREVTADTTTLAAILAIPLVPVGIYAVYPHPFYDSDTCLIVLAAIALNLAARDRPTRTRLLLAGAVLALPLFIKQTIGGVFLVLMVAALGVDALARPSSRTSFRWIMVGLFGVLAVELLGLQLIVGIDHYLDWAWGFAVAGRGVSLARIVDFVDPGIVWPAVLILSIAFLSRRLAPGLRGPLFLLGLCVWLVVNIFAPSALFAVPRMFPPVLIAASVLSLHGTVRDGVRFETLLPLVVAGATVGAVMSQGLYGSTYGVFPFLVLGIASLVRELGRLVDRPSRIAPITGLALAAILTVFGSAYTLMNFRLAFADVNAPGPVMRSAFPSLAGLSARGPYLADLDAMLTWARDNVPAHDPVVFLPGEDPAFFALGWRPRLPSVYFFDVANPYTPAQIARYADEVGLRWVFVKDRLQLIEEPPLEQELVATLTEHASLVARVGPYRIYRR